MDAIVALLVISLTFVLSFTAVQVADGAAVRAEEVREADLLLRTLMGVGGDSLGQTSGQSQGFSWTQTTIETATTRPFAICDRQIDLRNPSSHRTYSASTLETCPAPNP